MVCVITRNSGLD